MLPQAGEGFVWTEESIGPVLRCAPLGEVAAHVFSTRSLALERPESDGTAWRALAGVVGVVGHFVIAQWPGLLWSAGLLMIGTATHVLNAALSARGLPAWTFTARLVAFALAGFTLTALFGAALGVEHVRAWLPGAFFARLRVKLPEKLDDKERKLFEELREASDARART